MKIVITGVAGFIGYHLCKRLLKENISVIGIDDMNSYYDIKLKDARLKRLRNILYIHKIDLYSMQLL